MQVSTKWDEPNPPRWQSFARSFNEDVANLLKVLMPDLEADYAQLQNVPQIRDPLGARSRVKVEWTNELKSMLVRVTIDDDTSMPMLEPEAAQAYMIVQWPHLFRKKPT